MVYSLLSRLKPGKIFVRISGGLGNQLFQISAGNYFAISRSAELVIIVPNGNENQVRRFFDRDLFQHIKSIEQRKFLLIPGNVLLRFSSFLSRKNRKVSQFLLVDCPKEVGYSNILSKNRRSIELRGYYQSHVFASYLPLEVSVKGVEKSFSDWYFAHATKIEKVGNIAALHIRGTDYLCHSQETGLLSREYYESAIVRMKGMGSYSKIWVFSDDPTYAKNILANIEADFYFVSSPRGSRDLESLVLISKCSSIIIGNSTFAWWAAYLSVTAKHIYCPDKWFRGKNDPKKLIPESWNRVNSSWV